MLMKPAVGFMLPSAGLSPAPSDKKSQNGADAILLEGSFGEEAAGIYLARYFTGEAAGRTAAGR
jgi:hypothetical protein